MLMNRFVLAVLLTATLLLGSVQTASACPSCKNGVASDSKLPMAFQMSILFMLGVPATLMTGLGIGLYRMNKVQEEALREFESGDVWDGPAEEPREDA